MPFEPRQAARLPYNQEGGTIEITFSVSRRIDAPGRFCGAIDFGMSRSIRLSVSCVALVLTGCATMKVSQFQGGKPEFQPTKFFTGRTSSFGVMENRGGMPKQTVRTETRGRWERETLWLEQDLTVGDSKPQHRSWRIRKLDAHRYEATANDVVGSVEGEAYGNVFHWSFTLALSPGQSVGGRAHEPVDLSRAGWENDGEPFDEPQIRDCRRAGDGAVSGKSRAGFRRTAPSWPTCLDGLTMAASPSH
jgi:hypothetical protein